MSELEKEKPRPFAEGAGDKIHKHNEKIDRTAHKPEASVLHPKIIRELDARSQKRNGIVPFPEYNRILTWLFHCTKLEREMLLQELRELNLVDIVPFHGLKIKRG